MPLDEDPLYIRNPDPYMDGDKQLFVINPKYAQPRFADGFKVYTPYYDETPGPPAMPQPSVNVVSPVMVSGPPAMVSGPPAMISGPPAMMSGPPAMSNPIAPSASPIMLYPTTDTTGTPVVMLGPTATSGPPAIVTPTAPQVPAPAPSTIMTPTDLPGHPIAPSYDQLQPGQVYTFPEGPIYGQTTKQTDWMSGITDEAPLGALSIPGTHNSLANSGGPLVQFQSWDIATQLRAGIRFLDLRLRFMNNQIIFWNGADNPPTTLQDFMDPITKFLSEHPRETILAHISNEASGAAGSSDFYYYLHKTLNDNYGQYIFPLQVPNPTLGMTRGKMVIIKDYSGGPPGGLEYDSLDKVEAMSLASPEENDVRPKEKQFKDHLKKAMRSGDFSRMFLTVMSACGPGYPYQYAAVINEKLLFCMVKHPRGRIGIVAMDFPAEHIVSAIVLRNFKECKYK